MDKEQAQEKHKANKKRLEEALDKKFRTGRNADWGGMDILPIKGNDNYLGMFIVDLSTLSGELEFILMVRTQNPETHEYEDTDVYVFQTESEDIENFIKRLEWV